MTAPGAGRVCSLCGGTLDTPDSSCEGPHAAPPVTRGEKDDGPWNEDGYCHSCGNGRWKYHAPDCAWADARDSKENHDG